MKVIGSISRKTNLPQATSRLTARPYHGPVNEARGRPLVCSFVSGDLLAIRPLGLGAKRTVHIPLATLYENALYTEARALMRDKVNSRKRRR